ncbi:MAG: tRNA pseudouridine(13) synthase TruD [Myxococcota bacterium]|nr:tRNA pseudouridine(13) synthase TruD [Myxococcota bacterium]
MRIKQKPEDFSVKESYRFDEVPSGPYRIYLLDKQKLSTFDAIRRIRDRFGLRPDAITYCGLKDKQGRTEQIIAVDGADVDLQEADLRLKFLARSDKPLSARNTTSNRFSVTIRMLREDEIGKLPLAAADVNRLGVVNYFDDQRFGSLKHGQGFIAKDLIRGDFEAALKNYMAKPSPLDRSDDAKVKEFFRKNWGNWGKAVPPMVAAKKYDRVLRAMRKTPDDFVNGFLQIDADYRAIQIFTYQSYLWNECVRRLLQLSLPRESLFVMRYQAGTLLFHQDADPDTLEWLRGVTMPLLGPTSTFTDPKVQEAVEWVLGKEKLKLSDLRIEKSPKLLFFKHEERPVIIYPQKVVVGKTRPDEINRGFLKSNVAFTLPPGSYATLVIKRLFHFSELVDRELEDRAKADAKAAERAAELLENDEDGDDLGGEISVEGGKAARPEGKSRTSAGRGPPRREGEEGHRPPGTDRSSRPPRPPRPDERGAGSERGARPPREDRGAGSERGARPPREDRGAGSERGARPPREDRGAGSERGARQPREDRGAGSERGARPPREDRGAGSERGARPPREDRGAGSERGARPPREDRGAGSERGARREDRGLTEAPVAVREVTAPASLKKGFLERQREKKATRKEHQTESKKK